MEATNESILSLQQKAEILLQNIESIGDRSDELEIAVDTLSETNEALSELIKATQKLTTESHNIIKKLNEIGSARILDELTSMNDMLNGIDSAITTKFADMGKANVQLKQDLQKKAEENRLEQKLRFDLVKTSIWVGTALILILQVITLVIK